MLAGVGGVSVAGLRRVGRLIAPGRDLYVGSPLDVGGVDESLGPFVAFTALDARSMTDVQLGELARALLQSGCRYSCSWGPESGRVESAFDVEVADAEVAGRPYSEDGVMTTSHEDQSLDDALWFALFAAFPPGAESAALVVITDDLWLAEIERRLADPCRFNADVIAADEESDA